MLLLIKCQLESQVDLLSFISGAMFGTKELNKLVTGRVKFDRDCSHENGDQPPPPHPILASSHSRGKQTNSPN